MKKILPGIIGITLMLFNSSTTQSQDQKLGLKDALKMAATGNRPLQIQILERAKAAEAIREAQSARKPSVAVNAAYAIFPELPVIYLRNESSSPKVNDVKYGGRFAFDGNISAQYPIINPAYTSSVQLAKLKELSEKDKTLDIEESLSYNITRTYLSLLMNTEQKLVFQQSLARNEKALLDSRAFFLQGKNLKTDTLSHYIAVQNLKVAISALENEKEIANTRLNLLMGTHPGTVYELTDRLMEIQPDQQIIVDSNSLSFAMNNRKDLRIAQTDLEIAKVQLDKSRSAYKPTLSATATYQLQSQTDDFEFTQNLFARTSFVGLKLNIPVYSGNRKKLQVSQSEIAISQKVLWLSEMSSQIITELSIIEKNYRQAIREWQIQQESINAAQINYNILYDRYRQGLATRLELDDAELALTKSRLNSLQYAFNIKLLVLEWERSTGAMKL